MNGSLLNSAVSVRSVDDFRQWTRTHVRPVVAHESLVCGLGYLHAGGVGLNYIIAVDCPMEHFQAIRNRAGAIDTPILRQWLIVREPVFFEEQNPWPDTPEKWLESFRRHQLRNVVAHAKIDSERCVGTYHSFFKTPGKPDGYYLEMLCQVVPVMHEVMCRVVESASANDRLAANLAKLSEREREIVRWVGLGKTNPEIAQILDMAESTVKHYLSDIFDKLGMSNRAQLVRCLTEYEARCAAGETRML